MKLLFPGHTQDTDSQAKKKNSEETKKKLYCLWTRRILIHFLHLRRLNFFSCLSPSRLLYVGLDKEVQKQDKERAEHRVREDKRGDVAGTFHSEGEGIVVPARAEGDVQHELYDLGCGQVFL